MSYNISGSYQPEEELLADMTSDYLNTGFASAPLDMVSVLLPQPSCITKYHFWKKVNCKILGLNAYSNTITKLSDDSYERTHMYIYLYLSIFNNVNPIFPL